MHADRAIVRLPGEVRAAANFGVTRSSPLSPTLSRMWPREPSRVSGFWQIFGRRHGGQLATPACTPSRIPQFLRPRPKRLDEGRLSIARRALRALRCFRWQRRAHAASVSRRPTRSSAFSASPATEPPATPTADEIDAEAVAKAGLLPSPRAFAMARARRGRRRRPRTRTRRCGSPASGAGSWTPAAALGVCPAPPRAAAGRRMMRRPPPRGAAAAPRETPRRDPRRPERPVRVGARRAASRARRLSVRLSRVRSPSFSRSFAVCAVDGGRARDRRRRLARAARRRRGARRRAEAWRVWVHVAGVSAFVPRGSPLGARRARAHAYGRPARARCSGRPRQQLPRCGRRRRQRRAPTAARRCGHAGRPRSR